MTVNGLEREGDKTPGAYRSHGVSIAQSTHLPPEFIHLVMAMAERCAC
ncbi:Fic family protein [Yersinia enterocolitica]|nr:Fic family protein [Yersinia enterocolitica]